MKLTPQQRYQQALKRADILAKRAMRDFLADRVHELPCTFDLQRDSIVREIGRAYDAGRAALQEDQR